MIVYVFQRHSTIMTAAILSNIVWYFLYNREVHECGSVSQTCHGEFDRGCGGIRCLRQWHCEISLLAYYYVAVTILWWYIVCEKLSMYEQESERLVKARARSHSIEIVSADDPQASVSKIIAASGDRVAVLLNKRQRWTYTVFAYGCQIHPVSITSEISESGLCVECSCYCGVYFKWSMYYS